MNKQKNFRDFVPSKIAYIILGLFILGFISYGIYFSYKKKHSEEDEKLLDVSLVDNEKDDDFFLDSDHDGAYDWVENLWPELDPNNPDSDGDGVLDGKYIRQKQRIREKERRGTVGIESNLTESEKLGRSVYTALYALRESGADIDETTKQKISDNISNYISDLTLGDKLYLREDLNLVSDNKEHSFSYRNNMNKLFDLYTVNTSEIELIIKATKDPEDYKTEINNTLAKYRVYVGKLSDMNVPYIIAGRHTELLNAVGQLYGSLKNLSGDEYDDVVALSSIVQIKKTFNSIIDANTYIEEYFNIISEEGIFDN